MKLDVDLSALHSAVARMTLPQITASRTTTVTHSMLKRYHIVHSMEPDSSECAISSALWSSPLIPAVYCLFLAEESEGFHLSTQDIVTLLVRFYGFKRVPLDDTAIEIELYRARDEHCALAADILQQPLLHKEGLSRAIRDCKPIGFESFEDLIARQ
ncbi:hypothetical protein C9J12_26975 [Photobacterium frigidiphilum]|uniref:Uncharacterized protein n=1 Tax=Photobacterium frigidiphilum TaxID=264736 RepID=A0A2T3J6Z8_9GAMM|nr:hypothetical protein [Photobacterium frigidiphilum]PSU44516.1 hypothetical protein C9J12_26975 [Photobacterium frigidiphilum]